MPQASEMVRMAAVGFFGDETDHNAFNYLIRERAFRHKGGALWAPKGFEWSHKDRTAVDYLVDEWDYSFEGYYAGGKA